MGKLGKKARKFARKNLQSVLRRKRKLKSMFKKKNASRDEKDDVEEQGGEDTKLSSGRKPLIEELEDGSLDIVSSDDDEDVIEDESDSDELLPEDLSCLYASDKEKDDNLADSSRPSDLSVQNQKIQSQLAEKRKKLEALKQKDPGFLNFLESHIKGHRSLQSEEMYSDEDEVGNHDLQSIDGDISDSGNGKLVTSSTISNWCQLVVEQRDLSVLPSLLNAYWAACHYGSELADICGSASCPRILSNETFCSALTFMLREGDGIFRGILGVSSNCKVETILQLKSSSKWQNLKPMIKSYLKSTLSLVTQITDADILAYSLTRLRASIVFFAAFPSLLRKLMQVAVHFWARSGRNLSSCSFSIIHDIASLFGTDCYEDCLKRTYKAFIARCRTVETATWKDIQSLRDSFVVLCSIDLNKSVKLVVASTQKLVRIFQLALQTKNEEALKKTCSWEYIMCIDFLVAFLSANIRDNDLHALLFAITQVINGLVNLFSGPRYLPLRIRCIRWLNSLSSSGGIFIPISSLVLDILELPTGKEAGKPGKAVNFSTALKLPKYWLKSEDFRKECVSAVVELLSAHFAQWSYNMSFPELATLPVIRLRKFHEKSTVESIKNVVKRLMEQVEKNVDFVQKKRDEVSFAPRDHDSANSFLQIDKSSGNASYTQYYRSMIENAALKNLIIDEKMSSLQQKKSRRRKRQASQETTDATANGRTAPEIPNGHQSSGHVRNVKSKKQRT